VIAASTPRAAAAAAYEVGNLHLPTEIGDGEVIVPADEAVEAMLVRVGHEVRRDVRRFQPGWRPGVTVSAGFRTTKAADLT